MQDDIQIFRGSEFQSGILHCQSGCGATNQNELVRVTFEVAPKCVESLHHGKRSFNSSSASSIRSSLLSGKLRLSDSGSTGFLS